MWKSKLQTIISLSATDAKYLALSEAIQISILILRLLKETFYRMGL